MYKHAGYFPPTQAEELKALARRSDVRHPPAILRAFVRRYGQGRTGRAEAATAGTSGSRDGGLTSASRR